MSTQTLEPPHNAANRAGKYLTFALGKEEYGLEILKVREIIGFMDITAVPRTPVYVRGVINLRGQVISVIDLRAKCVPHSFQVGLDQIRIQPMRCQDLRQAQELVMPGGNGTGRTGGPDHPLR